MAVFEPHSEKQDRAIFSQAPIIIAGTGIQYGKTTIGAIRTKMAMHRYIDPTDNFIIAAPTYKIMQQATLPEFLKWMGGVGEYHKGDAIFKMHRGGTAYLRTATDPDSVVGITNVRHIWGDEAGLYSLYFHENLQARASFRQAPICYTTSPYALNWLYTDYIRRHQAIAKKVANGDNLTAEEQRFWNEVEVIQATSRENPFFPDEEYERKRATMDPRRFNMVYGGNFERMEGLVYDCFRDFTHVVPVETLPERTQYVAGVDWGFTNPASILVFGVAPNGTVYLVSEWYKPQQTIGSIVEAAKRLKSYFGIDRFYCDPSAPANIMEFNKAKLTAIPGDNDIRAGIDAFYEWIAADRFRVFYGRAPNFLDEISAYHYPTEVDVDADKDVKERLPVKQYDHAMDAARYCLYALKKTGLKKRQLAGSAPRKDLSLHIYDDLIKKNIGGQDYDW